MKIKYKALWIEDHFDQVQASIQSIEDYLEDYGFKFEVDKKEFLDKNELDILRDKLSKYNPYDMIFFDYDLGSKETYGSDLARELRTNIFTDMIFYSGKAPNDLRKILFDSEVEGVFTVSRTDLADDSWPIIEDQIKRICDINNMRGVILDEMSKIDLKMRELYHGKYMDMSNDEKNKQVTKIKKRYENNLKNISKNIETLNNQTFPDLILNPLKTEFNIIRMRLSKICENDDLLGDKGSLKYNQDRRNKFAHNKAIYDDEKGTVSLNGFEEEYSFENFKKIRKELIELSNQIDSLKK
ncbi:Uncharacterized protein dnl_19620 [Desulfonema limicola]|uniref:Uncharacterized protein n=1 Tax=Desulfonema limicola TaxID=45656 RepID=A0A975B6J3_9BACT|nr:hypothetical protein [Desulfonema limicola]QTA79686.1 Uncharacterized protein dnl_19620 [Desulfonema limicola]